MGKTKASKALRSILRASGVVLVLVLGACGVGASTSKPGGFTSVARLDVYDLYVGCVNGDKVYIFSRSVAVIKDDC